MDVLAKKLTEYIYLKGCITKEQYDVYKYGFKVGIEILCFVVITLLLAIIMGMFVEYCVLLFILGSLRTYTNGAHLSTSEACLVVSIIGFTGALWISKYISITGIWALVLLCAASGYMWYVGPMNDENYVMNESEKKYFAKKLNRNLIIILMLALVVYYLRMEAYVSVIVIGMLLNVISMLIGRWQYSEKNTDV